MNIPPKPKLFQVYKTTDEEDGYIYYTIYIKQRETILWGLSFGPVHGAEITTTNLRYWDEYTEEDWEVIGKLEVSTEPVDNFEISNKSKIDIFNIILKNHKDSKILYR